LTSQSGDGATFTVAVNHTDGVVKLPLATAATDLLTGQQVEGDADVPAGAVRVLRQDA